MLNQYPYPEYEGKRSIAVGILLTLITCGIYGLYWQYKQMATLNVWLERNDYSFWLLFLAMVFSYLSHLRNLWNILRVQDGMRHQ